MISRKKPRFVLSIMATGLLSMVCASSHAGRSVRSDSSDGAFDSQGGFWGEDTEQSGVPGFTAGRTEFKLKINPGGNARFFTVCMGQGFIKFIHSNSTCVDSDFALPPTGNYVAVFAADQDESFGRFVRTRGFIDSFAPFKLWQAKAAMRFWWNNVALAADSSSTFDVQISLIDRSNGTNNGNFDIELNYGVGGDVVPPVPSADGFQGFVLGPNSRGPTFGPFGPFEGDGDPIRFCFRGGSLRATCN